MAGFGFGSGCCCTPATPKCLCAYADVAGTSAHVSVVRAGVASAGGVAPLYSGTSETLTWWNYPSYPLVRCDNPSQYTLQYRNPVLGIVYVVTLLKADITSLSCSPLSITWTMVPTSTNNFHSSVTITS